MKLFQDNSSFIILQDDEERIQISRDLFVSWEPDYSLPEGVTVRFYDGVCHWISDGANQNLATDITAEKLDLYLDNLQVYKAKVPSAKSDTLDVESSPNWKGLENDLRGTEIWAKAFSSSMRSVGANAAMTLLLMTLSSTHSLQDLRFAFSTLRQVMNSQSSLSDFTESELSYLYRVLENNKFDPAIIDL